MKDNVQRLNCRKTSHEEFVKKYERPSIPVVLVGAQENWRAIYKWNLEVFYSIVLLELYKCICTQECQDPNDNSIHLLKSTLS